MMIDKPPKVLSNYKSKDRRDRGRTGTRWENSLDFGTGQQPFPLKTEEEEENTKTYLFSSGAKILYVQVEC